MEAKELREAKKREIMLTDEAYGLMKPAAMQLAYLEDKLAKVDEKVYLADTRKMIAQCEHDCEEVLYKEEKYDMMVKLGRIGE
jgi:hypothetical protein